MRSPSGREERINELSLPGNAFSIGTDHKFLSIGTDHKFLSIGTNKGNAFSIGTRGKSNWHFTKEKIFGSARVQRSSKFGKLSDAMQNANRMEQGQ
jgi:hypothetical protein